MLLWCIDMAEHTLRQAHVIAQFDRYTDTLLHITWLQVSASKLAS